MTKKLSQFGHSVRKYNLVNAVMANFNTNIRQMIKTSQQKKQAGGYINSLNMCPCHINILLDFWYYRRNIKDGLDNSEFAKLYDLMAIFAVGHILLHPYKNSFHLLIMLKQKQTC